MDERTDSGEFYPGGDRRGGDPIDLTFDDAVTRTSARAVKSSGIWSAIWGALAALPAGVASLYDWCVSQLAGKLSTSGGIVHGLLESSEPLGQSFTGLGVNGMVGYYGGIRWGLRIGTGDNVDFPVLLNKNGGEIVVPSSTGTLALLSDIPDVSDKADTADLRYALVDAPLVRMFRVPDEWFPITFTYGGAAYSVPLMDKDMIVVNDGYLEYHGPNGEFVSIAYFDGAVLNDIAPEVSSLQFNGAVPVEGETALDATTTATLADRAVNLVTAGSGTASIDIELPELANVGRMRDFYVRLTVSATSASTWTIGQGESWDAMGSPPASFSAGTYLYHITEVAPGVFHCEDMFGVLNRIPMYQVVGVTPSGGTLTVTPYSMATYTAGTSAEAFTVAVGTGAAGTARDCELVIDCTATGAVAPTVTWPATFHPRTDAATDFACEAGVRNVYYISEFASGEFAVGGWQETAGGNA